ncbi:hypothetical protein BDQ12DRAFT_686357 [Crucibulum laeve]|uniref:Uncharacterized protein n=1 Tax=Crucibulum laeve TaxID=68775 RepID=A0A5C3M6F7_9AGAR|nr:hypothetical protein BDQ12DRAFT_686357 [Crucibulum laeve]
MPIIRCHVYALFFSLFLLFIFISYIFFVSFLSSIFNFTFNFLLSCPPYSSPHSQRSSTHAHITSAL